MLKYGNRMEKSQVACHWVEEEGLSFREAERVIKSKLFLDKYPQWGLQTPHQMVILHEMFLHATGQGQKEAEHMSCLGHQSSIPEPNPKVDQSAMELVGYQTSRKEIREVYHSVYLLRRSPGSPSCGESKRKRAIQDILSSLQTRLQRWTYSAEAEDLGAHGREGVGLDPLWSYEAALLATHQKAFKTTEALQDDLERLNNECRGRSWVHSQSRSRPRTWSGSWPRTWSGSWPRIWSRNQSGAHSRGQVSTCSQSHPHADHRHVQSQSLAAPWNRRVSFHDPENEDSAAEGKNPLAKPSMNDLEMWLEYQAEQIGTPMWWRELETVPGITNRWKFAQKIRASFYVLEVWSRMFPEEGYSAPPGPQSLNRGAYLPDNLTYQDVRQQPTLLTVGYCPCLQHWVEKCILPGNPDFCPLAKSMRELRQAIHEFTNITQEDVMKGLEMEEPEGGHQPSPTTIFSQVLGLQANRQEAEESSAKSRDRAITCAPPTLRLEQEDCFVLVITSLMSQLTIGAGSNNIRRGRNSLWSRRRAAIFLPHHPVLPIEGGATSMDPNATSMGPTIEDITDQEWEANWNPPLGKQISTHHCMTGHSQNLPLGKWITTCHCMTGHSQNSPLGKWITTHQCMTGCSQYLPLGGQLTTCTFLL